MCYRCELDNAIDDHDWDLVIRIAEEQKVEDAELDDRLGAWRGVDPK